MKININVKLHFQQFLIVPVLKCCSLPEDVGVNPYTPSPPSVTPSGQGTLHSPSLVSLQSYFKAKTCTLILKLIWTSLSFKLILNMLNLWKVSNFQNTFKLVWGCTLTYLWPVQSLPRAFDPWGNSSHSTLFCSQEYCISTKDNAIRCLKWLLSIIIIHIHTNYKSCP